MIYDAPVASVLHCAKRILNNFVSKSKIAKAAWSSCCLTVLRISNLSVLVLFTHFLGTRLAKIDFP
jgi:hypothetical protein